MPHQKNRVTFRSLCFFVKKKEPGGSFFWYNHSMNDNNYTKGDFTSFSNERQLVLPLDFEILLPEDVLCGC